jgi:5-histidylcysteine sulfoxide synthase/putative 4-mercaptohistidine N1-methyltranferase
MTAHASFLQPSQPLPFTWTGKPPHACAGVNSATRTLHGLPQLSTTASRQEIQDYFDNGWTLTELLFSGLANEEAYYARAYHKLRMPMLFYLAHPAVLYVNKLRVAGLLHAPVNPAFEALFETGVDEMRWDNLHEDKTDWPPLREVFAYRAQIYTLITTLITEHPALDKIAIDTPAWALYMGFEHERIHLETSSVLMRELPLAMLRTPEYWPAPAPAGNAPQSATMRDVAESRVILGKPRDYPSFGWDNEYGNETRDVPAFQASNILISNAQFLDFMRDGGYTTERYWSEQGWAWRSFRNVKWPSFFVPEGPAGLHHYRLRTIFEEITMPMHWPVCVNWFEAQAYCAWKTETESSAIPYRLLTEAEHHALRDEISTEAKGNHSLRYSTESDVMQFPANSKGFHDVFGNVWQWLEDHFHPLHGSTPHPYYDDFSVPCYDGEHQMILGGSFISCGDEASVWARFHFRPHFFQHAGFRVARSAEASASIPKRTIRRDANAHYESDAMLGRYLHMHYAPPSEHTPSLAGVTPPAIRSLPEHCAELAIQFAHASTSALDVGCAVGRSTFEMATHFEHVVGIDLSQRFIDTANQLKRGESLHYSLPITGIQRAAQLAKLNEKLLPQRVQFEQGDAMALPPSLNGFDAILIANTICRLPNPSQCLRDLVSRLNPKGIVVVVSPYSWFAEFTPQSEWIEGGEALAKVMTGYQLLHEENIPFLITDHARKYEYIISHATVWQKP